MRSMTGYSNIMRTTERYDIFMELKSVNSRYFEFKVRSAYYLSELEMELRNILFSSLKRGKIDLFIKVVEKNAENYNVAVNYDLAKKYEQAFLSITDGLQVNPDITLRDITQMDGVLNLERVSSDPELEKFIFEMLHELIERILEMMNIEGNKTVEDIINSLDTIDESVKTIDKLYPEALDKYRENLRERIKDFSTKGYDDNRIMIEVDLVASRTAINEEVVRLDSHIRQVKEILKGKRQGNSKKLDFISQEMNREANTIASKSSDFKIIENTIIIKSEIEKIREQLRNLS